MDEDYKTRLRARRLKRESKSLTFATEKRERERERELTLTNFEFPCSLSCKYIIWMDKDKIMMLETERIKRESKPLTFATENKERENEWLER